MKAKLNKLSDWMKNHNIPPRIVFFILGIISTIWFLVRVIPKPSRATYPCMRVAAPFMSGLVVYLLAVGGLTALSRKFKNKVINVRYAATFLLVLGVIAAMAVTLSDNSNSLFQTNVTKTGPDDGPNQPFGKPTGIFPGRVVWIWNPDATNEKFEHNNLDTYDLFPSAVNNNEKVIGKMFRDGMIKLTGEKTAAKSWDAVFKNFNAKKSNKAKGYTKGEKILIKINQGQSRWLLTQEDKNNGYYVPKTLKKEEERRSFY